MFSAAIQTNNTLKMIMSKESQTLGAIFNTLAKVGKTVALYNLHSVTNLEKIPLNE